MLRPLAYPLFALIAGIFLGSFSDFKLLPFLAGILVVILGGIILTQQKHWHRASLLLIISFAFVFGLTNMQKQLYFPRNDRHISNFLTAGKITLEGTVSENPDIYPDRNSLTVKCIRLIDKERKYFPVEGNIRLTLPPDFIFEYGDLIRFQAALKNNHGFKNPGGFDYERYLRLRGIAATANIADNSRVVLLRKNTANSFHARLESFRMSLKDMIKQYAPFPSAEIIMAMTLGMKNEIPPAVKDSFARTGTSHLLAISGLHIGMVGAAAFLFFTLLMKSSEYLLLRFNIINLSSGAAFLLIVIYALIAGMGITVIRAALMALIFLGSLLFNRQRDFYNSLILAALLILSFAPEALFDISFQLSFTAVLAILYITPRLDPVDFRFMRERHLWLQKIFRYFYLLMVVSLAATAGTLPLIVYHFHIFSAVTLLANLIVIPLLGMLALCLAMLSLPFSLIVMPAAGLLLKLSSFFVYLSVEIINWLASLPYSYFTLTRPDISEIIMYYLFLFMLIQLLDSHQPQKSGDNFFLRHKQVLKYCLILIIIFFAANRFFLYVQDRFSPVLHLTAIDVGQGSANLIRFPGGQKMLIDGGGLATGSLDIGKMVIAPFLYNEKISKIDIIVLTHPHPDHYQGLIYILDNFNVREFWHNGQTALEDESYNQLREIIARRKIKTEILTAVSPTKTIGGAAIQILWPEKTPQRDSSLYTHDAVNDASLVTKIKYGKMSFLLTGDISATVERAILKSGRDINSTVLFVPHHGSFHSSSAEFLTAVGPRYAAVSAGRGNVFRHPHPAVLERYQKSDTEIFRTDQDGAITFATDGISLTKDTFIKRSLEK